MAHRIPAQQGSPGGELRRIRTMARWWRGHELIVCTALSGLFLAIHFIPGVEAAFGFPPALVAAVVGGAPIVSHTIVSLVKDHQVKADLLVSIALIAALVIGEYFAAGEVAFIMLVGELLEERTSDHARRAVRDLVRLVPETATVRRDGREQVIPLAELKVDDTVLVKSGERLPVDGVVVSGQAAVNQAAITGESLALHRKAGDEVFAGSLSEVGALEIRATRVGVETTIANVAHMVAEAQESRAPIQRLADRWATWLVPASLLVAAVVYFVTFDAVRAVTILIVFCPCALVIATPTAVVAGIGNAARRGILVKNGLMMEAVGKIDTVVLDKTGTLTRGEPRVTAVLPFDSLTPDEILARAAVCEARSEHPLARAILDAARERGLNNPLPDSFEVYPGQGVVAGCPEGTMILGRDSLLRERGIAIPEAVAQAATRREAAGETVLFLAREGRVVGLVAISDTPRSGVAAAVGALREQGIRQVIMLTGDNAGAAVAVAAGAGISEIFSEQIPRDKVARIKELKAGGARVAMVGDGINDAPALATADVGIAMGVRGTDLAAAASGVTLMSDDLARIPELLRLGRRVLRVIRQNLWASALINIVAVTLAALGLLGPVAGALVHNVGSLIVVANSAFIIGYHYKRQAGKKE